MKTESDLLGELFEVTNLIDDLNEKFSAAYARRKEIENRLVELHNATGLSSLSNEQISVSFTPNTPRAVPNPEDWDNIHKWFVENGYGYCVHRRLSDSKVMELLTSGVELPKGLDFEFYTKVSFRRKK